jgi:hypothetical protein
MELVTNDTISALSIASQVVVAHNTMQLLTGCKLQIIVMEDSENMKASHEFDSRGRLKAWLCFLLALLFLYNPYLTLTSSSTNLNVRHPASYRASVGSSELQHFSPTDGRRAFATMFAILFDWFASPLNSSVGESIEGVTRDSYACKILCADLWFRPPPVI